MKIYIAALNLDVFLAYQGLFPARKLNVLRSFGMPSADNFGFMRDHRDKVGSLVLDSGTWTLNNPNATPEIQITLENYKNWVLEYGRHFNFIFNFDSDFTERGFPTNLHNQNKLEEASLNPVPVVHDIYGDEVDYYINEDYPLVAIGSFQITNILDLNPVVHKLHQAGIKVHLFGTSQFDYLAYLPVYSCDSTTWLQTGAFGKIYFWNPMKSSQDKTDIISLEERLQTKQSPKNLYSSYAHRETFDAFLAETFGITYENFLGTQGHFYKRLVNLHYFVQLEEIVDQEHQKKGFVIPDC